LIDLKEIKNKILTKNNLYCLIVISIIFFLDRYTKFFILNNFTENTYHLNDYINLDLVWNTGIGFGLFSSNSDIIYSLTSLLIAVVIMCLIYFLIASEKLEKIIYSIIIGGALGNFYDRMFFKSVPDFIDLHYKNFHWFTFNLADIFITIGIVAFLFKEIFKTNQ
tara:strand:+ start:65 stop:559 length:495 start_codon:yes stop_codon:yes gene_type:complete